MSLLHDCSLSAVSVVSIQFRSTFRAEFATASLAAAVGTEATSIHLNGSGRVPDQMLKRFFDQLHRVIVEAALLDHAPNLCHQHRPEEKHRDDRRDRLLAENSHPGLGLDVAALLSQRDLERRFHPGNRLENATFCDRVMP